MKINWMNAFAVLALTAGPAIAAGTVTIDFQPTGGTTAAGALAFENDNQVLPDPAGTAFTIADQQAAGGSDVGSDFTISLAAGNLPDAASDFRSVTRNGAAEESVNDWIGVDSRNGGTDVTLDVIVSGLASGEYTWVSTHHDGGSGTTNGNQRAPAALTFDHAGPSIVVSDFAHSEGNGGNTVYSQFMTNFTSDGSPVSLSISVNDTGLADFGYISELQLSQVPEPSSMVLIGFALLGFLKIRRR